MVSLPVKETCKELLSSILDLLEEEELLLFDAFLKFDPELSTGVDSASFLSLVQAVHPSLNVENNGANESGILVAPFTAMEQAVTTTSDDEHIQFIEFLDWWHAQKNLPGSPVERFRGPLRARTLAGRVKQYFSESPEYQALLAKPTTAVAGLQRIYWQIQIWKAAKESRQMDEDERTVWEHLLAPDPSLELTLAISAFKVFAVDQWLDRNGLLNVCRLLRYDPTLSVLDMAERLYFNDEGKLDRKSFLKWWCCRDPIYNIEAPSNRSNLRLCFL